MAENKQTNTKKLGQTTNIKISGKQYASYDMPNLKQQKKEVHTVTGTENAPRDISKKNVDNLQNVIKTETNKNLTDNKADSTINKKELSSANKTAVNSAKTKIDPNITKKSEVKQQTIKRVQRQSAIVVTPQTIISKPKVQSGYNAPNTKRQPFTVKRTGTGNKTTVNSAKTKISPPQNSSKVTLSAKQIEDIEKQVNEIEARALGRNLENDFEKYVERITGYRKPSHEPTNNIKLGSEVKLSAEQIEGIKKEVEETAARAFNRDMEDDFERYVERITGYRKPSHEPTNNIKLGSEVKLSAKQIEAIEKQVNETEARAFGRTLTKNIQRESSIVVAPQTIISKPKVQTNAVPQTQPKVKNNFHVKGNFGSLLKTAKKEAQSALNTQDDSGSQTLSTALYTGDVTVRAFKTAQNISPHIIKGAVGMYQIGEKTVRLQRTVDATVGMIRTGAIKIDRDTALRLKNMAMYKLKSTRPAQNLIHAVTGIKTAVDKGKYYSLKIGHGVQRAAVLARGVTLGTVRVKVTKDTLNAIKNTTIRGTVKGAKVGGKILKHTIRTGSVGAIRTGIKVGKGINRGLLSIGDTLTKTGDTGMQALGLGLKTTHYAITGISYTPRLAKATYRGIKTGIDTMVKTGKFVNKSYKGIKTGVKIAKKVGGKNALKLYSKRWGKSIRGKALKAIQKAGNSVVTAAIEVIKKLGAKVIIPLILILLIVLCGANVITSFVTAVSAILSPFFTDDSGNEVNETDWLITHITDKRNDLIQDIKDTYDDALVENGGEYHYVRFFNVFNDAEIELNDTNINTSIYTVEEYQRYIQPIFHTLIMSEYELEASETQMEGILDDIWDKMTTIVTEELPTEYCHMTKTDNADGTYTITPVKEKDDNVHADTATCPNYSEVQHHGDDTSKPLCSCDYWYWKCNGHTNDEGEYSEHSGKLSSNCGNATKHKGCNGYYICYGHKILALSVELRGFDDLLNDYFLTEINDLESKPSLTDDEQRRLKSLKEYYEICLSYALILEEEFGVGEGTVVDLDGVTLTEITEYACQFVGKPYVWGGTNPNTGADCSGFVQYVYGHFGVSLPRVSKDQVSCGTTVTSISNAQPGDLIFWSNNGSDSGVYHVAMYLGGGKIVHASNSKPYPQGGIKISNVYGTIHKIKRIAH